MPIPRFANLYAFAKNIFGRLLAVDDRGEPSIECILPFVIPDAATGDVDVVMTQKCEVIGMTCIKRNGAGAGNTVTLKNSATAISDAVACAVDDTVTNAATIIDGAGTNIFAIGDTLRLSCTRAAGTRNSLVLVRVLMRA